MDHTWESLHLATFFFHSIIWGCHGSDTSSRVNSGQYPQMVIFLFFFANSIFVSFLDPFFDMSSSAPPPPPVPFDPWRRVYAPFVAEFLGSLSFTLFSDLLGLLLLPDPGSPSSSPSSLRDIAPFEGALLLALICAFRPISGAHFNPALTLASLLTLDTPLLLGLSLLFAQFFGAFFGALLFHSALTSPAFLDIFLRLGTIHLATENLVPIDPQQNNGAHGLELVDSAGPLSNKFQIFLLECLCSSLLVLINLFTASQLPLPQAVSVASARAVASGLCARSPLGQSANLARALANALLASIFITDTDRYSIWRLFYCHFFGALCSAILGAALFWIVKFAMQPAEAAEQQQQYVAQQQHGVVERRPG